MGTPVCGGQWQSSNQGNSFSCGQGSSGYNPGYGYNPAINIPPQNGYMGVNTLPAGNTGCSMGGGCSDGGSGGSGMRPVDVETGNQPIILMTPTLTAPETVTPGSTEEREGMEAQGSIPEIIRNSKSDSKYN